MESFVNKKKKEFEKEVAALKQRLDEVHKWKNLGEYKRIMPTIRSFHAEVEELERKKQQLATE